MDLNTSVEKRQQNVEAVDTSTASNGWFNDNIGWMALTFSFLVTGVTLLLKFADIMKFFRTRCKKTEHLSDLDICKELI